MIVLKLIDSEVLFPSTIVEGLGVAEHKGRSALGL